MPKSTDTFTPLELEAALCVWEWVDSRSVGLTDDVRADVLSLRQAIGTVELRSRCGDIGRYCLKVYDHIPETARDGHAYDWEIIPAILETFDWARTTEPPHPPEQCALLVAEALTASLVPTPDPTRSEPAPEPYIPANAQLISPLREVQLRATKLRVIAELAAADVARATIFYKSTDEDTFTVGKIDAFNEQGLPAALNVPLDETFYALEELLERFTIDIVCHRHNGFQDEAGCEGYVHINVAEGTVAIEHTAMELAYVNAQSSI